jgi:hypothetical protein
MSGNNWSNTVSPKDARPIIIGRASDMRHVHSRSLPHRRRSGGEILGIVASTHAEQNVACNIPPIATGPVHPGGIVVRIVDTVAAHSGLLVHGRNAESEVIGRPQETQHNIVAIAASTIPNGIG